MSRPSRITGADPRRSVESSSDAKQGEQVQGEQIHSDQVSEYREFQNNSRSE